VQGHGSQESKQAAAATQRGSVQTAQEADGPPRYVEQVFSRAGLLADPNLLPAHLSTLVTVGFNRNAFKPQIAAIKDKYYEMFRNKTKS
jgi:hypothetical protein